MNNIMICNKKIRIFLLTVVMGLWAVNSMAQRISGTVEDDMGPVMMATVVEKDANNRIVNHTSTDINGNFSMTIKSQNNTLQISFVGNKTVTLPLKGQTVFNVKMEAQGQIQEVVIKGVRRQNSGGLNIPVREMTVASQTMKMEDVEGLAFTSADEALQGEIAGLDIVSTSGNLGAGTQMRLRGVTTINGRQCRRRAICLIAVGQC